ncbi:MAG: 2-C-methyl-D-erythritol 2,4-cyclodiphosphate synthase [Thermoleophilia bacterium]|nr:2-C-methyl-D-erythritol 2,4-cyclodiphosphate synthase [Thermoleophilia bacterium]
MLRVGIGFDAHRFASKRSLVLGGVRIRDHDGLEGHSDADVLTHAIIDALLGAVGLEDIGVLFPDTDPRYKDASSVQLLEAISRLLWHRGWSVVNVDAVVICEEPKIVGYRAAMQERLAKALGVTAQQVMVKGTTTEGMGFPGRKEGIAAQAVALVMRFVGS